MIAEQEKQEEMLEARYFQNDIVATAFEIFEKTNNFEVAIHLLLKVIGVRLELDRITIVQTDITIERYILIINGTEKKFRRF